MKQLYSFNPFFDCAGIFFSILKVHYSTAEELAHGIILKRFQNLGHLRFQNLGHLITLQYCYSALAAHKALNGFIKAYNRAGFVVAVYPLNCDNTIARRGVAFGNSTLRTMRSIAMFDISFHRGKKTYSYTIYSIRNFCCPLLFKSLRYLNIFKTPIDFCIRFWEKFTP